jgi:hypothetical protein
VSSGEETAVAAVTKVAQLGLIQRLRRLTHAAVYCEPETLLALSCASMWHPGGHRVPEGKLLVKSGNKAGRERLRVKVPWKMIVTALTSSRRGRQGQEV